jgi:hypothetical protein
MWFSLLLFFLNEAYHYIIYVSKTHLMSEEWACLEHGYVYSLMILQLV